MIDILDNKNIIIGAAVAIFLYILLKSAGKKDKDFEREYNEILNSDKYKAKGQY